MDDSSTMEPSRSGLAGLGSLLPGVGLASQPPPPLANGHVGHRGRGNSGSGLRGKDDDEEEEEEELDTTKLDNDPQARFRIGDIGASDSSGVHSETPIIRIQKEDGSEHSPLFSSKKRVEERRRQKELEGASMPPLEAPQSLLAGAGSRSRGSSTGQKHKAAAGGVGGEGGASGGYGTFGVTVQDDTDRSRSPSPSRKSLRKTISGESRKLFKMQFRGEGSEVDIV